MNTTSEITIYCNILDKLSKDFIEKNSGKILAGTLFIMVLQHLPDMADKIGYNFRYWVDAKYGVANAMSDTYEGIVDGNCAA